MKIIRKRIAAKQCCVPDQKFYAFNVVRENTIAQRGELYVNSASRVQVAYVSVATRAVVSTDNAQLRDLLMNDFEVSSKNRGIFS
jgi:hypothetical protein